MNREHREDHDELRTQASLHVREGNVRRAPQANFNYSTSYLFSNGPFSHVGLKADFAISDDFSLMLGVMNPWDTNDITTTGEYSFGAQLGYKGQYLNFYYDSGKNGGLRLGFRYCRWAAWRLLRRDRRWMGRWL